MASHREGCSPTLGLGYLIDLLVSNDTPHSGEQGVFKSQELVICFVLLIDPHIVNNLGVIMFKKQEQIFDKAVQIVCDECCITPHELRFGRNRASSDARFILVRVISPYCSDNAIASKLGRTRQGVCFIRNKRADKSLLASIRQVESKLNVWVESAL